MRTKGHLHDVGLRLSIWWTNYHSLEDHKQRSWEKNKLQSDDRDCACLHHHRCRCRLIMWICLFVCSRICVWAWVCVWMFVCVFSRETERVLLSWKREQVRQSLSPKTIDVLMSVSVLTLIYVFSQKMVSDQREQISHINWNFATAPLFR